MTGGFEFGDDASDDSRSSPSPPDSSAADGGVAAGGRTSDDSLETVGRGDARHAGDDPELAKLLYEGEAAEAILAVDGGRLVRTRHRFLAHTPDADGRTLAVVQRPNVEDVTVATSGDGRYLSPALKAVLVGGVLVAAGVTVPVDGMASAVPAGAGAAGIGGTLALLGRLLSVVSLLDDGLRLLGALAMLVGVALLGLYLRSRTREVVVSVAGEEDLAVPAADVAEDDVAALSPGPAAEQRRAPGRP